MPKVLLIEDDEALARGLEYNLAREGFEVVRGRRGDTAPDLVVRTAPDIVTLDVMLPGQNGFDVLREVRRRGLDVPVILLTARGEELDRILGLEIGADDYLVKPFSVRELVARLHARLRRSASGTGPHAFGTCRFGQCEVDFEHFQATRAGQPLDLTAKEFAILKLLVQSRGQVVSRNRLLDEIWGAESIDARRIDTHIVNLRRKIEDDPAVPRFVQSVYGEGYRFAG